MFRSVLRYVTESWTDQSEDFLPFDSDLADGVEGEFGPYFGADEQLITIAKSTVAGPEITFSTGTDGNWNVAASAENIGEVAFGLTGEPSCKVESSFPLPWGSSSVGSCLALLGASTAGEYTAGLKIGPLAAKMVVASAPSSSENGSADGNQKLQLTLDASAKFPVSNSTSSMYLTLQDAPGDKGDNGRRVGISWVAESWTVAARQSLPVQSSSRTTSVLAQAVTDGVLGTASARITNSAEDGWGAAAAFKWLYTRGAFPATLSVSGNTLGEVGAAVSVDVVDCSFSLGAHSVVEGRRPSWPTFGVEAKF